MRILTLAEFYPPVIGGLEKHAQRLTHELKRRGHEVAVATLAVPDLPEHDERHALQLRAGRSGFQRRV